jgi:hypothetical protein
VVATLGMTDIMISVIPSVMEVIVTSKSLMVRSVPNNLKPKKVDQRPSTRKQRKSKQFRNLKIAGFDARP